MSEPAGWLPLLPTGEEPLLAETVLVAGGVTRVRVLKAWTVVVWVEGLEAALSLPGADPEFEPGLDPVELDPELDPLLPPLTPVSAGEEEEEEEVWVAVACSAVTGQMVVEIAMISVVTDPTRAGQSVTVGAQEVTV